VLADEICDEDAAFIAAARTALPALIELVEAQKRLIEVLDSPFHKVPGICCEWDKAVLDEKKAATAAVEAAKGKLESVCGGE